MLSLKVVRVSTPAENEIGKNSTKEYMWLFIIIHLYCLNCYSENAFMNYCV